MWKNNEYKINLSENSMYPHEKVMLSSGECSYLFPMVFMGEKGQNTAYYDCSGFAPLSSYRVSQTDDAMYILEQVMLILNQVTEYLISPSRVTLSLDTIFYNIETGEIKIAYIPLQDNGPSLKQNMLSLISQLKKELNDGHSVYLDKVARLIHYNNYQIRDIVNSIGLFRRDLYQRKNMKKN